MNSIEPSILSTATATRSRAKQTMSARAAEIIKQRIKCGVYATGEQLPSIRALGAELEFSPRVIQLAIEQLEGESVLETRHGVGVTVLDGAEVRGTALWFGFVQPYFSRFSQTLQVQLEDALDKQSNLCVMKSSRNDPERERQQIERLIESGVNGLLIWPIDGDTNGDYLEEVSRRLPVVFVDRTLPNVSAPSVVQDCENGGHSILQHLYKSGCRRVLVVCDPVDISTFNQLKQGLRDEADKLGISNSVDFVDYQVIRMIEASYQEDYSLAETGFKDISTLLANGKYDALFCPQSEFFDLVFPNKEDAQVLAGVQSVTMRGLSGGPHSRFYRQLNVQEWTFDNTRMLVQALEILQNMTLRRKTWKRNTRLPITLSNDLR